MQERLPWCAGKIPILFFFLFKEQISDMQDTSTDDEEYDQNSNHGKTCQRRRRNSTDFDDTIEERQSFYPQSLPS